MSTTAEIAGTCRARRGARFAAATALLVVLAGSAATAATGGHRPRPLPPEQVLAPDREVTAGLHRLVRAASEVAALRPGSDQAKKAAARLEPLWSKIEGTVRKKEPNMYARVEEDLALLGNPGDASGHKVTAAQTRQGAYDLGTVVAAYLKKHPQS